MWVNARRAHRFCPRATLATAGPGSAIGPDGEWSADLGARGRGRRTAQITPGTRSSVSGVLEPRPPRRRVRPAADTADFWGRRTSGANSCGVPTIIPSGPLSVERCALVEEGLREGVEVRVPAGGDVQHILRRQISLHERQPGPRRTEPGNCDLHIRVWVFRVRPGPPQCRARRNLQDLAIDIALALEPKTTVGLVANSCPRPRASRRSARAKSL